MPQELRVVSSEPLPEQTDLRVVSSEPLGDESSAASRFFGLRGMAEPVLSTGMMIQAAQNPALRGQMAEELIGSHIRPIKQGFSDIAQGRLLSGAGNLASGIPLVGPLVRSFVDQAREGDVAGAAGRGVSTALMGGLGRVAAGRHAVGPIPNRDPVSLSYGQRTGNPAALVSESILRKTIPSAGKFMKNDVLQQEQIQQMGRGMVRAASQRPVQNQTLGRRILEGVNQAGRQEREALQARLAADVTRRAPRPSIVHRNVQVTRPSVAGLVDESGRPAMVTETKFMPTEQGGVTVPLGGVRRAVAEAVRQARREGEVGGDKSILRATTNLRGMKRRGAFQDVQNVSQQLRSTAYGGSKPGEIPPYVSSVLRRAAGLMDKALKETADEAGFGPEYRAFRRDWAAMRQRYERGTVPVLRKLGENTKYEEIPQSVLKNSLEGIEQIRSVVPPDVWNDVRASVLDRLIRDATTGEMVKKSVPPGPSGTPPPPQVSRIDAGPRFRPAAMRQRMETINKDADKLGAIFGPEHMRDIQNLQNWAQAAAPSAATNGPGAFIAAGINVFLASPLFRWGTGVLPAASLAAVLRFMSSRLLAQPKALGRYAAFMKAIAEGDMQSAAGLSAVLSQELGLPDPSKETGATGGLPLVGDLRPVASHAQGSR